MGTNYYMRENICNSCGRYNELHIGKSSYGWAFSLRIYIDENIRTLSDWKKLWQDPKNLIFDEYDNAITVDEMISCITDRQRYRGRGGLVPMQYCDISQKGDDGDYELCAYEFC